MVVAVEVAAAAVVEEVVVVWVAQDREVIHSPRRSTDP